ncbi:unnamed protein product [Lepeophtheirus salmonis]|uniref:(salmon louse) hypothetical protein n=1 Tax=Lepeophtheirus salmonis TaxID=72036 RepID=A0A7R8H4D9_LEPSM|nr:unnamed protein product [Lepeophtheirus salmonis]CAF2859040.1 unnamed protein product [Lepeophtheirus salmonis]
MGNAGSESFMRVMNEIKPIEIFRWKTRIRTALTMEIVALILEMYPPSSILSCLTDNRLIWRDLNNLRKRLNNILHHDIRKVPEDDDDFCLWSDFVIVVSIYMKPTPIPWISG